MTGEIRQHRLLGQYWLFSQRTDGGKVYRRADTEVDNGVFLYFHKDQWWVGDEVGKEKTGTWLRNGSSKRKQSHPPMHNWQEINYGLFGDSWQQCDLRVESEVGTLPTACNLHVELGKGKEKDLKGAKEGKVLGNFKQLTGRWSLGRRVNSLFSIFFKV